MTRRYLFRSGAALTCTCSKRPRTRRFSFEDGLTRRSPKLAQRAFAPALASRGALRDLASQTDNKVDTGAVRVESPSSPRERRSVNTVRRSIISMRDSNFIKKDKKHIPHFRRTELFPSGGGKPEGKEGEQYSHVRGRQLILFYEHDATFERAPPRRTAYSERPRARRKPAERVSSPPPKKTGKAGAMPSPFLCLNMCGKPYGYITRSHSHPNTQRT